MTNKPAIKIVINSEGELDKVEIWEKDSAKGSLLKIYGFLSPEILEFTKKTEQIVRDFRETGKSV